MSMSKGLLVERLSEDRLKDNSILVFIADKLIRTIFHKDNSLLIFIIDNFKRTSINYKDKNLVIV